MLTIPLSQLLLKSLSGIQKIDLESYINIELASISDWLKTNKLSLSIEKSKYMIFHTPQKK